MQPQPCAAWLSSSRAPSEVIIIGTLCFSQTARSCSSRLFDRCTIWLTANGADGRSGCALSWAASSSLIRASHSSSSAGGRAFSAGNDPTTPALHCAITRSGTEMMNSGAPITGNDRQPLNKAGMDIRNDPYGLVGHGLASGCQTSSQQGNLSSVRYCVLTLTRFHTRLPAYSVTPDEKPARRPSRRRRPYSHRKQSQHLAISW